MTKKKKYKTMINLTKLPILSKEYENGNGFPEYLIDNPEYRDKYDYHTQENSYIVYEYIHNIPNIILELKSNKIEFSTHVDSCGMSYLLINKLQNGKL
tara:strand:- start:1518 stop:1811 length:294 start_codon:yes stop_codon:yes gene_type:complete